MFRGLGQKALICDDCGAVYDDRPRDANKDVITEAVSKGWVRKEKKHFCPECPILACFPGIKAVALELAHDNGMINRFHSSEEWLKACDFVLGADGVDEADLIILDTWCQSLSLEQQIILAVGETSEMEWLVQKCPKPELCGLFNDIFEMDFV
jgi:hypothetical protein